MIPVPARLAYSAFVAVLVPFYLATYGPTNFLYFCDVALLLALAAVWTESALLAGMAAVGIVLPQMFWVIDYVAGWFGVSPIGLAGYMFKASIPLFARSLSLFHGWLPFFLLWLVKRLGYDGRSFAAWTALGWGLMLVSYFVMPGPPAPADQPNLPVNINYVFGLSETEPQSWLPPLAYLGAMMLLLPLAAWWPTHVFLARFARPAA
jgi:hypothetical protein